MKKLYTLAVVALAALYSFTASADTDVTALYIKNAGFDTDFNYTKDKTGNIAQEILDVKDWTKDISVDYTITGVYEFGAKCTFNTSGTIPAQGIDGSAGCLALSTGWEQSLKYYQEVSLPAGTYKLQSAFYNGSQKTAGTSLVGWIPASGTAKMSQVTSFPLNQWTTEEIEFTLTAETKGKIQIGLLAAAGGSANSAMVVLDYVRLILVGDQNPLAIGLAQRISDAEKLLESAMQPKFKTALEAAIAEAKAVPEDATDETITAVITALDTTIDATRANIKAVAALKLVVNKAKTYTTRTMAQTYSDALKAAYDEAVAIVNMESDADIDTATDNLNKAYDDAVASYTAYTALNKAIRTANSLNKTDKQGVEELEAAIIVAQTVLDKPDATPDEMEAAAEVLNNAILLFRVANGTGTAPTVTTVTSFVIPAAHGALIRANFKGSSLKEQGICWSTDKEPTITDNRSTDYYTLNGNIYHIKDMKPATVYYARAYAISATYAVGYGDVVKVVTLPEGTCVGTWDEGAPTAEANRRCRTAIQETMDYLNEWTAIKGFTLSGHYGANTPTADCSYGGWMRIGPNAGNQAIGTVIHETGHGVGVGTHWRWNSCTDTRESEGKYGKWLGSWANKTLQFLENKYSSETYFTGDAVHGWGHNASYDWFVNGADKDTHTALQYIGGCALLYALYIDGLCPTTGYANGVPGYTYNFDDEKKYYIKSENEARGLYDGYLCQRNATSVAWKQAYINELNDSCAWYIEYAPTTGHYRFKNVATGRYLSHPSSISMQSTTSPGANQNFQLLPGRNTLTINQGATKFSTMSYWFSWTNNGENKSMSLNALNERLGYGTATAVAFNYSDAGGVSQRYVLISEDELAVYEAAALPTGIRNVNNDDNIIEQSANDTYDLSGRKVANSKLQRGLYIIGGKKVTVK